MVAKAFKARQALRSLKIVDCPTDESKIRHILQYGILAPSTHNTQPWKFQIQGNRVNVFADFTKKIPEADPTGRDMYMSVGALVKNIELACQAYGVGITIHIQPHLAGQEHVATLELKNLQAAKEPNDTSVLDALIQRQNYRGFFKPEINHHKIEAIIKTLNNKSVNADVIFEQKTLLELARLTAEGLKMGYASSSFRHEISSYINHNLSRKRHGLHGYSLRMNFPVSVIIPRVMKRKDIGPKLAELNYKSFISAPGVIVLSAPDDQKSWFETGRVLEEIQIQLTRSGLTSSIYAAAIEMGTLRGQVARLVSLPPGRLPQLLFCIGTATSPLPHSVRKKLDSVIIQ